MATPLLGNKGCYVKTIRNRLNMKASELQIGDWVDLSDVPKEIIPCKVVEPHTDELLEIQPNDTACDIVGYDMVRPVTLTAEILEKNGFIADELCLRNYQDYTSYHRDGVSIVLESKWGNAWTIMCDYLEGDCPRYVHQLQNLFRVYGDDGLTDLADNFKI